MTSDRDGAGDPPGAVYSATAIAARLGVAVETLRTWDRRYGVGPTGPHGRGAGGRRRYREADVERLLAMRRLVSSGIPTREAARLALRGSIDEGNPGFGVAASQARSGDGSRLERGLLAAASRLDAAAVSALLDEVMDTHGVEWGWNEVLGPALSTLGARWEDTGSGIEVEHLLSQAAGTVLRGLAASALQSGSALRPTILLAAVEGEHHVLTLEALAALMAEKGLRPVSLGASTPAGALSQAISRLRPLGIFLWARFEHPAVHDAANEFAAWTAARPRRPLRIAVGGDGWSAVAVPATVRRVSSLHEALAAFADG